MNIFRFRVVSMLLLVGLVSFASVSSAQHSTVTADGLSLIVPQELAGRGKVFYALPGRDRQLYLESNAPLENIKGQSNGIIGFAVAGNLEAGQPPLIGAEFQVPVVSIKTGIDLRDEHMAGPDWLDAAAHPNVIFRFTEVESWQEVQRTDAFTRYSGTLVGELTLKGTTRPMRIADASVVVMPESARTASVAKGDLVAVRANFQVTLADFGIEHPVIGDRVARDVSLQISLYLSSVPPHQQ